MRPLGLRIGRPDSAWNLLPLWLVRICRIQARSRAQTWVLLNATSGRDSARNHRRRRRLAALRPFSAISRSTAPGVERQEGGHGTRGRGRHRTCFIGQRRPLLVRQEPAPAARRVLIAAQSRVVPQGTILMLLLSTAGISGDSLVFSAPGAPWGCRIGAVLARRRDRNRLGCDQRYVPRKGGRPV